MACRTAVDSYVRASITDLGLQLVKMKKQYITGFLRRIIFSDLYYLSNSEILPLFGLFSLVFTLAPCCD
jgi:hypothetical protein